LLCRSPSFSRLAGRNVQSKGDSSPSRSGRGRLYEGPSSLTEQALTQRFGHRNTKFFAVANMTEHTPRSFNCYYTFAPGLPRHSLYSSRGGGEEGPGCHATGLDSERVRVKYDQQKTLPLVRALRTSSSYRLIGLLEVAPGARCKTTRNY